jgi:hypothetical protein
MFTKPLSERQRQKLESVRSLLRGKSLILHGGTWTAEAREPKRQQLLFEQLTLARQLRQTMENTAETADQEGSTAEHVTKSLLDQASRMHQLTALTQAVQRQHVQESYDDYEKWAKEDRQQRNKKVDAAKAIIRDQCERLADPKKERPSRIPIIEQASSEEEAQIPVANVPEEAMKPAAVSLPPTPRPAGVDERDSSVGIKKPAPLTTTPPPPTTPPGQPLLRPTDFFEVSRPQKNNRLSLSTTRPTKPVVESPSPRATATTTPTFTKTKSKKKRPNEVAIPPPEAIRPDDTLSSSTHVAIVGSASNNSKKRKSSPPQRRQEQNYTAAAAATANSPASTMGEPNADARPDAIVSGVPTHAPRSTSRRQKRRDGPKKCHNCKTWQTEYLKCNYFLVTGNRCGKFYCSACLKDDYGEDVDLSATPNDDWKYVLLLQQMLCVFL